MRQKEDNRYHHHHYTIILIDLNTNRNKEEREKERVKGLEPKPINERVLEQGTAKKGQGKREGGERGREKEMTKLLEFTIKTSKHPQFPLQTKNNTQNDHTHICIRPS